MVLDWVKNPRNVSPYHFHNYANNSDHQWPTSRGRPATTAKSEDPSAMDATLWLSSYTVAVTQSTPARLNCSHSTITSAICPPSNPLGQSAFAATTGTTPLSHRPVNSSTTFEPVITSTQATYSSSTFVPIVPTATLQVTALSSSTVTFAVGLSADTPFSQTTPTTTLLSVSSPFSTAPISSQVTDGINTLSTSHSYTPEIVGATIGSSAGFILFILLFLLCLQRRKTRRRLLVESGRLEPTRTFPSWPSRLSMYLPIDPTARERYLQIDGRSLGAAGLEDRLLAHPPYTSDAELTPSQPTNSGNTGASPMPPSVRPISAIAESAGQTARMATTTQASQPSSPPPVHLPIAESFLRPSVSRRSQALSRASSSTSRVVSSRFSIDTRGQRRHSDPFDLEGDG